jgi:hypothetical protein
VPYCGRASSRASFKHLNPNWLSAPSASGTGRQLHQLSSRIVSLFFAVAVPLAAAAEPDRSQLKHLTIDDLKAIYAACNNAVLNGRIDFGTVAQCSVVYEELKERAFGGDFARLREWSRSQPSAMPVAQPTQRF